MSLVKSKKVKQVPLKLVACDKGAVARTQRLAAKLGNLQIIYLEKKRIGADYFILGNTLSREGLEDVKGVIMVDLAPAIYGLFKVDESGDLGGGGNADFWNFDNFCPNQMGVGFGF